MPHNIERSAFRKNEYIGYGLSTVWRILKGDSAWYAFDKKQTGQKMKAARTLNELSVKLSYDESSSLNGSL